MINAVVISTNFRNVENWQPVFEKIIEDGGRCSAIYFPWKGDDSLGKMNDLKMPVKFRFEISSLNSSALSEKNLEEILIEHVQSADVVFICDMQSYPSSKIYEILLRWQHRPLVIGLQHGLYQSWWLYNRNFCADYLFAFNGKVKSSLFPQFRRRTIAVGLPKLDRLARMKTRDLGYILYIAQKYPEPHCVSPVIKEIEEKTEIPVFVRNHPQYPGLISHLTNLTLPLIDGRPIEKCSYDEQLANASWVLTSHSTGGLEALCLKKNVVLLPNHGLTAWTGYPGVSFDISSTSVLNALQRVKVHQKDIELFLRNTVEGRFKSYTKSTLSKIYELMKRSM